MTLPDDHPNETTSLLKAEEASIHNLNPSSRGGEHEDFSRESHTMADMARTTHNDPDVREVSEDMSKLVGSTKILYNEMEKVTNEKLTASLRKTAGLTKSEEPSSGGQSLVATVYKHKSQSAVVFLEKVKTNFFEDAQSLAVGTIPQSIVVATVIGIVCGVACWIYYSVLFFMLEFLWETLPEKIFKGHWIEPASWLWIPFVSTCMLACVGLTVTWMGEPGDLPYTIGRVHHFAYIPIDHVLPMVFASLFSILAGGSLGPEAPLVAICGAIGGFVSRTIFRQKYVDVVRKHTLMGMAGALAAFFGAPLGGSIFALEVCSRFGVEYFEHLVESIFCGEICLVVFRSLSGLAIAPIWDLTSEDSPKVEEVEPWVVLVGGAIGLVGALMAYVFATFHWRNMAYFASLDLMDNSRAVHRALLGGVFIIFLGLIFPHTMFWGEEEFDIVANMGPSSDLPNVFPTGGLFGFEMDTPFKAFVVGLAKLVAISFTVAGGLRGGYIFPLMCSGAAFGRCLHHFLPDSIPVQVTVLCMAAGMNVAITRTALASTLILAFLPEEPFCIPAVLMASLCSLFATAYVPFIKTQITRSDIDHSLFHEKHIIDAETTLSDDEDGH